MNRYAAPTVALWFSAILLAGAAACGQSQAVDAPDVGSVGLVLGAIPGITLKSVSFTITGNGIPPITGSVDVSAPHASASFQVGGVPAGTGYLVTLTATSVDGQTTCVGTAIFNVAAGTTSTLMLTLQCSMVDNTGGVMVSSTFDNCPTVSSFIVSPTTAAAPGGVIEVSATGSDPDSGAVLTFNWTATSGLFVAPGSASTTYLCGPPGTETLTVSVSDGSCARSSIPITVVCASGGS